MGELVSPTCCLYRDLLSAYVRICGPCDPREKAAALAPEYYHRATFTPTGCVGRSRYMTPDFGESRAKRRRAPPLQELERERNFDITMSTEVSTQTAYTTHIRDYAAFCRRYSLDLDPTPNWNTLSLYIAATALDIAPSAIDTYLSGICWHLEPFFPHVRESRNPSASFKHRLATHTLRIS